MAIQTNTDTPGLAQLLQGFALDADIPDLPVSGISSDSREIRAGDVFVAAGGLTHHAIDFSANAIDAGAIAVLYDADDQYSRERVAFLAKQYPVAWIAVADLVGNCGRIASRFYGDPSANLTLIGVTGTDGKTSVTHLMVQALGQAGRVAGSIGTLGFGVANRLQPISHTTPDAIALQSMLYQLNSQGCEVVVMEVSSHALDQQRVNGCVFDLAVLTNLGSDHLDYHQTLDRYGEAKARLFGFDSLRGRVLNGDDSLGQNLALRHAGKSTLCFTKQANSTSADSIRLESSRMTGHGLEVVAETQGEQIRVRSELIGSFNIDNLLACIGALKLLGLTAVQIEQAMQGLKPIPGRMDYFPPQGRWPAVVIDFAHTEQALRACLQALQGSFGGALFCVFGCGGDRDTGKRPLMAAVAEQFADQVIVTDDNPRGEPPQAIMQDILEGFSQPDQVRVIHDRATAIRTALQQAGPRDIVVIAGKGHEKVQIIGDQQIPFSDHQVVRAVRAEEDL